MTQSQRFQEIEDSIPNLKTVQGTLWPNPFVHKMIHQPFPYETVPNVKAVPIDTSETDDSC